jgi:3-deoxy-D-manno-octulosonate 8-phosphate phosphatase (KDO 8-P phosphatase)
MDLSKLTKISCFAFDVDGVFTNGDVLVLDNGSLLRIMNTRDGQGIKIALDHGYKIAIFTKGMSKGVRKRFKMLGVKNIYDRLDEKSESVSNFINKSGLKKEEVLYMGDDIPDLAVKDLVGVFSCPADASPDVLKQADFISAFDGGRACVRDIIERVMRMQDKWPVQ